MKTVVDFLSTVVTGFGFDMQVNEYINYAFIVAGINVVVMIIEKVFGLFAIVISDVKKGRS
jgi:hypothetical protein